MSISLGAAAVGALVALVFAGLLARRCVRAPRMATVALLLATAGLTVALGAQAGGYYHGFDQTTFRAVQLGAQLIAPLALVWAMAELTAKSMGARFASRLALGAVTVVGAVVLATDPLTSAGFSKTWPAASVHYQLIPNGVLKVIAVVTVLASVIALIVTGVRARQSPGWRTLFLAVAAIAVGVGAHRRDAGEAAGELRLRGDLRRRRGARLVRGRAGQRGTAGVTALRRVRLGRGHRLVRPVPRRGHRRLRLRRRHGRLPAVPRRDRRPGLVRRRHRRFPPRRDGHRPEGMVPARCGGRRPPGGRAPP